MKPLKQARLEEFRAPQPSKRHVPLTFKLTVILVVAVLLIALPEYPLASSEPGPDWAYRTTGTWKCQLDLSWGSPRGLASYIWGGKWQSSVVKYFADHGLADLSNDTSKPTSPTLTNIIVDNTDLAIQLSRQFEYGTPPAAATNLTLEPFGRHWTPIVFGEHAEQMAQRGASLENIIGCYRNEFGFDWDFISASLDYANSRAGTYYSCAFPRNRQQDGKSVQVSCLNPSIYGQNPYVIKISEPTWLFLASGHVTFFGTFFSLTQEATQQAIDRKLTLDQLFGGGYTMLIVPESVVNQVGLDNVKRAEGLYVVVTYGITPTSAAEPHVIQFTQQDFQVMQDGYTKLHQALRAYGQQQNQDFDTLRRVPLDSLTVGNLQDTVVFDGFPDPVQEMADAFADPSCQVSNCVLSGKDMATHYAQRVYQYMYETGMFSHSFRTGYLKDWMRNYIADSDLNAIPQSQIYQEGSFMQMHYKDSIASYRTAKQNTPRSLALGNAGTFTDASPSHAAAPPSLYGWSTEILQVPATQQPALLFTTKHVPVISLPPDPTQTVTPQPTQTSNAPLLGSLNIESFMQIIVGIGTETAGINWYTSRKDVEEDPLKEDLETVQNNFESWSEPE